jgi:co-chaperonin GroES (HSP10)
MATKFAPLHDRILVRRVEEAGTTRGGILLCYREANRSSPGP